MTQAGSARVPARGAFARRRGLLVFAAAGAVALGLPRLWRFGTPDGLEPHPDLPGFRRIAAGSVTRLDPLIGLDRGPADAIEAAPLSSPCAVLFRQPAGGHAHPGPAQRRPLAFFTDINCPYCRVMEPWMQELEAGGHAVSWHDLPLLGPTSVAAARAIAAADLQGAGTALRARLTRSRFRPDAGYLTALAEGLGLDAPRLLGDMASPAVTRRIAQTLGLGALLGIPGTPALVAGDILAVGQRSRAEVDALLRAANPPPCP